MNVLYTASLLFGILSIVIALAITGVESVLDAWWGLASIFSGGMLGLFLLGYLSKSVRNIEAAIGVIVGFLVIVWMSLSPIFFNDGKWLNVRSPIHSNLTIVFGTLTIFLVGFVLAKLGARKVG